MESREERRRDYDVKLDVLTERVENWMETTTDYRKALCGKLDLVTERLNQLQCPMHNGKMTNLQKDVDRLELGAKVVVGLFDFVFKFVWGYF